MVLTVSSVASIAASTSLSIEGPSYQIHLPIYQQASACGYETNTDQLSGDDHIPVISKIHCWLKNRSFIANLLTRLEECPE